MGKIFPFLGVIGKFLDLMGKFPEVSGDLLVRTVCKLHTLLIFWPLPWRSPRRWACRCRGPACPGQPASPGCPGAATDIPFFTLLKRRR